ncbi:hypothetical protein GJ496_005243 [Pomphorhynchus laevis]|nr:hypothetical protein GJ496_005243 [Pomphorhynchus laevis]
MHRSNSGKNRFSASIRRSGELMWYFHFLNKFDFIPSARFTLMPGSVRFLLGQRKSRLLIYENNLFNSDQKLENGNVRWRCRVRDCSSGQLVPGHL